MTTTDARTSRHTSPLRYPGGKAKMAPFLSEVFASQVGYMDVEVWVEPFAGGAGAGLSMLDEGAVGEVWLYDKNPAIAALWRSILHAGEAFASRILANPVPTMALWEQSREVLAAAQAGERVSDTALGFAAFVINRCSRSGIIDLRVGPIGGKSQSGKWTVASRWNAEALAQRVLHIHSLESSIRFEEANGIARVVDLTDSGIEDEVMLFVDPPYLREGNRLYTEGMSLTDHQRLADALNACPAKWMLTYDNEPAVFNDLYPECRVMSYAIANTANRARVATEYAVLSDNLDVPPTAFSAQESLEVSWLRG